MLDSHKAIFIFSFFLLANLIGTITFCCLRSRETRRRGRLIDNPTRRWRRFISCLAPQLMSLNLVEIVTWPAVFHYIMQRMDQVCEVEEEQITARDTSCASVRDERWLYVWLVLIFSGAAFLVGLVARVVIYHRKVEAPVLRYKFRVAGLTKAHFCFQASCFFMIFLSYPSVFFSEFDSWGMLQTSCVMGFFMVFFYEIGFALFTYEVSLLIIQHKEIGRSRRQLENARQRQEAERRQRANDIPFTDI